MTESNGRHQILQQSRKLDNKVNTYFKEGMKTNKASEQNSASLKLQRKNLIDKDKKVSLSDTF